MRSLSIAILHLVWLIVSAASCYGQTRQTVTGQSAFPDWDQQVPGDDGSRSIWRVAYVGK